MPKNRIYVAVKLTFSVIKSNRDNFLSKTMSYFWISLQTLLVCWPHKTRHKLSLEKPL